MSSVASFHVGAEDYVEAELNYLVPNGKKPVTYAYPAPPGVPQQSGEFVARRVRITDGRRRLEAPSLDRNGFQLLQHRSRVRVEDFSNAETIRSQYYPEAEELIKQVTSAVKVVIFDHTLRFGLPGHGEEGVREPVKRVHNDQTFVSAPRRVRDHLPVEEAEQRLRGRFAIINLWRPIGAPVESHPLALCDAPSIAPTDLVPSDLVYRDKVGETYALAYNPAHRWFYFPRVRPDEVQLLKIYDSASDGRARLSAHTAFEDPTTPPDAAPRRSIELRTLVFWPN